MDFLKGAKDFARNPLGIIALFISLIYGFASLLLNSAAENLTVQERWPLIIFIVVFPILVLVTFYKLVTNHHGKLYAPGDFKDDKSFLRTLSPEEQEEKLEKEIEESLSGDEKSELSPVETIRSESIEQEREKQQRSHREFRDDLKNIENSLINSISSELKVEAERNVGIGETEAKFDAFLQAPSGKFTFLEIKAFRSPHAPLVVLDRILYQAVIADRYFESNFKLILAVVYYFEEEDLERVKRIWRQKIDRCPVDIELRFLPRSEILNA
jgi:hypothetical protein